MKILKRTPLLLGLLGSVVLTNCDPSDDTNDPDDNAPSIFSVNTIDLNMNSATILWTEANDRDGDTIKYTVYLENNVTATDLPGFTYTFTGLEPDTSYTGYVEARDGRGGTSTANFAFTTEPEVIIMEVPVSVYEYTFASTANCGSGVTTGVIFLLGADVPKYEGTATYQAEFETVVFDGYTFPGRTVTWDNDATTRDFLRVEPSGDFYPYQSSGTIMCSNNPVVPETRARFQGAAATQGTVTVTIVRSSD